MRCADRLATPAILAAILACSITAISAPIDPRIGEIGRWPYGPATTVARDGDLVFFSHGSVLQVLRTVAPDRYELLSETVLEDGAREIVVHGHLLYIALGSHGVQVVDVAEPTAPRILSTKPTHGHAYSIALSNDVAWVSTVWSGIQAFDISDPTDLERIGAVFPSSGCFGLTIAGGVLWATSDVGLHGIDISNPTRPRTLSTAASSQAFAVTVVDDRAYTAADWAGLDIFDVSDPAEPVFLGRFFHGDLQTSDVEVSGSAAFIISYDKLRVVDVSDPAFPVGVATIEDVGYGPGHSLALDGNWLAVADSLRGLRVFDVSNPEAPQSISTSSVAGYTGALAMSDDVVYLASLESGGGSFRTIDISDPSSPSLAGGPVGPEQIHPEKIVVIDGSAYVADFYGGVHTFDVRIPGNPAFGRSTDDPPRRTLALAESEGYLLAAGGHDGLFVFSLDHPLNPREHGRLDLEGEVQGVDASDGIAYIVGGRLGLILVDLTDPSEPMVIHQHSDFGAFRVAVEDSIAYVAAAHSGLIIIDVSNPFAPVELARVEDRWVGDVAVSHGRVVILTTEADGRRRSARFLDVSNPARPVERGFHLDTRPWGLAAGNRFAALPHSTDAFHLIDLDRVFDTGPVESVRHPAAVD
jgi:hypothetical protein